MFACDHPAIEAGVRAPLVLQTILGFDAATIASAFLVSPATMGQRLVRAKHRIKQAAIPFTVPAAVEMHERLDAVLEAIYAAFAEGWSDPAGTEARRRNLAEEGIWLGRPVASLWPDEPEALGLLALMLHAEARRDARRDARGEIVPLDEQDPARWNSALIDEAEALLRRACARRRTRSASCRIPALLGGASRAARAFRQRRRGARSLPARDRPGIRSGGAAVPAAAERAAQSTFAPEAFTIGPQRLNSSWIIAAICSEVPPTIS
jgi:predicted RNA polymerase sigma factor